MLTTKILELFEKLDTHGVYEPRHMAQQLQECGIEVQVMIKNNGIIVEGHRVESVRPEMGAAGIDPLHVLGAVFEIVTGKSPVCELQGRGFWYRGVLNQLKRWVASSDSDEDRCVGRRIMIRQEEAIRRVQQGRVYLIELAVSDGGKIDPGTALAVISVIMYLGAYAFPEGNLYELKKEMIEFLEPFSNNIDLSGTVDKAADISEVFRRPWTEPGLPGAFSGI